MADPKHHDDGVTHDDAIHGSEAITQDTNTDERYSSMGATMSEINSLNAKRTYDLHQTLDADGIHQQRNLSNAENQMRLRHAEAQHSQAMRHAETEHTIKTQTLAVSSVGNSKVIEQIVEDAATKIVNAVRGRLAST